MNISHCYKYLYFVIPKAGSTTIRHSLAPFTDIGYPVSQFEQHVTVNEFLKIGGSKSIFKKYFKFTFVRNPYDRLYSGYLQDRKASVTWQKWIDAKAPIFNAIGDDFNTYLTEYVAKANLAEDWDWICFCPMTAFSHRNGKYVLDWYGKSENIEKDLVVLGSRLGIEIVKAEDLNVNTNPQKGLKYLDRYTRQSVEMVNKVYAKDFDFFGYRKVDPKDFPDRV